MEVRRRCLVPLVATVLVASSLLCCSADAGCACDGSVLTSYAAPTATVLGGKDALSKIEVVDEIKEALSCPGVVSYADIVAMATLDPVVLVKNIMFDLEKGVEEGRDDAPAHQAHQDMADDDDQDHLTLELLRIDHQKVEVGAIAGEINHGQKKWLPAGSSPLLP